MRITEPSELVFDALARVPVPMYATDPGGQVCLWTQGMRGLTGVENGLGRQPGELVPMAIDMAPLTGANPLLEEVLRTGEVVTRSRGLSIRTRAGERAIDFRGEPITRSDTVVGALAVLTDVTEKRSLERTLEGLERTAGHDLRNAVGVLEGYLPLLESDVGSQAIVQTLVRTSQLLNAIVSIMLSTARCSRLVAAPGPLHGERRQVLPNQLVAAAIRSVEPIAANKDITLEPRGPAQLTWRGYPELLQTAVTGLLFAASKLARNRSTIECTLEADGTLRVTFRARALDRLDLERMFSFLGEPQDPRVSVGISVCLSRAILELHGATLALEEPEAGLNVFISRLPGVEE
ncbi:MAG TPA: hypothetical protein VGO93_15805 [Candidatus Xenobia bacterium]